MATNFNVEGPAAVPETNRHARKSSFFVSFIIGSFMFAIINLCNRNDPSWEFVLDSLSVSNLNITDNQISGDWVIGLNISNPGRRTTNVLEEIEYSVDWSGSPDQGIVSGDAKPVVQPPKNRTTLYLKGSAEWLTLNNMMAGDFMRRDVVNSGSLAFDINFSVRIRFKTRFSIDHSPDNEVLIFRDIKVPVLASSNSTPNTLMGTYHNTLAGAYRYHW